MKSRVKCSLKWWQSWWQGEVVCAFQSTLGQSLSGLFWDAELGPEPGAIQTQCAVPEGTHTAAGCGGSGSWQTCSGGGWQVGAGLTTTRLICITVCAVLYTCQYKAVTSSQGNFSLALIRAVGHRGLQDSLCEGQNSTWHSSYCSCFLHLLAPYWRKNHLYTEVFLWWCKNKCLSSGWPGLA